MRYSAFAVTSAGSTTLPIMSLYAVAGNGCVLREVGVFNSTATASNSKLVRLTSLATAGATITAALFNPNGPPALCLAKQTHSSTGPSLGADIAAMPAGAGIGAGTILTFYGENNGLYIAAGTANGIGILPLGTGQVMHAYMIWDE